MTEWAASGWIGDLGAPLLLWASASLGWGFRGAFVAMGLALFIAAWAFSRVQLSASSLDDDDDEPSLPLGETLRLLSRQRLLFLWLGAVAFCTLLDEIVSVLVGLRLEAEGIASVATSLLAFTLGGIFGLLLLKVLLRRIPSTRVLELSCIGCGLAYASWLVLPTPFSPYALFVVGVFTAMHYPIAQAQAYQALPERSTLVAAAGQPFVVFDVGFPMLLGWLADGAGVVWALALLSAQPLGILVVCWLTARPGRTRNGFHSERGRG